MNSHELRLLTPAELQERAKQHEAEQQEPFRRREAEQQERARQREAQMLAELDAHELQSGQSGRPRLELPPAVARRVLDDLKSGASYQAIASKYRRFYRFSPSWLGKAWKDGRLERMATADSSDGGPPAGAADPSDGGLRRLQF